MKFFLVTSLAAGRADCVGVFWGTAHINQAQATAQWHTVAFRTGASGHKSHALCSARSKVKERQQEKTWWRHERDRGKSSGKSSGKTQRQDSEALGIEGWLPTLLHWSRILLYRKLCPCPNASPFPSMMSLTERAAMVRMAAAPKSRSKTTRWTEAGGHTQGKSN